MVETDCNIS